MTFMRFVKYINTRLLLQTPFREKVRKVLFCPLLKTPYGKINNRLIDRIRSTVKDPIW